ncbi:hypothetical protein L6452_09491 [Arctium lappa]|uniref:Uncharacterized protein n=1 Tax=Arctium lappa TaxID=4217 RepID=A0ACB9DL28_ARCLA|nr:hypothetical protein L6452_09491 [Arctium lappa]
MATPLPPAPKVSIKFSDVLAFGGPAPERINGRISSRELFDLVIVFPLQQLGRLAHCIWACFCLPPSPTDSYYYSYASHGVDSDSDSYMSFVGGQDFFEDNHVLIDSYSDSHSD